MSSIVMQLDLVCYDNIFKAKHVNLSEENMIPFCTLDTCHVDICYYDRIDLYKINLISVK